MNSQITFALAYLPDISANISFLPAALLVLIAISLKHFKTPLFRISLVVLAQVAVLAAFEARYQAVVDHGQAITLKAHPVDPFDIFRGNYQSINYDISNLDRGKVKSDFAHEPSKDDIVYVTLKQNNGSWEADAILDRKPSSKDVRFIKGRIEYAYANSIQAHYGIEQWFYPENNRVNVAAGALASITIDQNGDAVLTSLIPDPNAKSPISRLSIFKDPARH